MRVSNHFHRALFSVTIRMTYYMGTERGQNFVLRRAYYFFCHLGHPVAFIDKLITRQ